MQRDKNAFMQLGLAGVIMQYLYICPGKSIQFANGDGAPLAIAMDSDMAIVVFDPTDPESIPAHAHVEPSFWAYLADYLTHVPPIDGDLRFPNYLSQITSITAEMTKKFHREMSKRK